MKRSIYALALGAFGIITTEFGVIGILPGISRVFGVSIETAGWLLSAFAFTVAASSPFITALTRNINRKVLLSSVLAVFVFSNLLSAFSPNFTVLMVARILPAFIHPLFWNIALSTAFKQGGAKAVSVVMTGVSVGTVLGVPMTTFAADLFSHWQASFILASTISLIAFLGLIFFVPSTPVDKNKAQSVPLYILKSPRLWLNLFSAVLTLAAMFSSYSYLAAFLDEVSKMSGPQISLMLLLFGTMGILGNWLMGICLSKHMMLTIRLFFVVLIAVQLMAFFFGGIFIPMVIIVSLWGMVHTGGFLMPNIRTLDSVPGDALEFVNSLLTSCYNIGISVGALLGGVVITYYGVGQVTWMSLVLLTLALGISFISLPEGRGAIKPETVGVNLSVPATLKVAAVEK